MNIFRFLFNMIHKTPSFFVQCFENTKYSFLRIQPNIAVELNPVFSLYVVSSSFPYLVGLRLDHPFLQIFMDHQV